MLVYQIDFVSFLFQFLLSQLYIHQRLIRLRLNIQLEIDFLLETFAHI